MDSNMLYKQLDCGFAMFEVGSDDEATDGWTASFSEMSKAERVQEEDKEEGSDSGEVGGEEARGSQFMELNENDTLIEKQVNFMNMYDCVIPKTS